MRRNPFFYFLLSFAVPLALAGQSPAIKEPLQNLKESINDILEAKDKKEKPPLENQLNLLKQTFELSIAEANEITEKIGSLANLDAEAKNFKAEILGQFSDFTKYYGAALENIRSMEQGITEEEIRKLALEFKKWREETYLPSFEKAKDFILIYQTKNALIITENRYNKISDVLQKLKNALSKKGRVEGLEGQLKKTGILIEEGFDLNREAEDIFWLSTSSPSHLSIQDLVGKSFEKIRSVYQIFIEMSNTVRKLLK